MAKRDAAAPVREVSAGEITATIGVVAWGTPGAEGAGVANTIETEFQLNDTQGDAWGALAIVRFTCTAPGTLSLGVGVLGTVISGSGTNDMIVETDATGAFSLLVTDPTAALVGDIYVMAGATQGSVPINASSVLTNTFA